MDELLLEKTPKGTSPVSSGHITSSRADFTIYFLLEAGVLTWALRSLEFPGAGRDTSLSCQPGVAQGKYLLEELDLGLGASVKP